MAFIPSSGSVVAFQSDPTKLVGTVSVVGNMNSSVTAFQGTNPWIINQPSPSVIAYQLAGSILAISGSFSSSPQSSIIAIQTAGSVMAVRTDNASIIAVLTNSSVAVLQGTNPWNIGNSSVQTIQGTTPWVIGSVIATIQSSVAVAITNITSSIIATQGTSPWVIQSVVGTYPDNSAWTEGNSGLYALGVRNDTMSSVSAADVRYSPLAVGPVGETIIANAPITKWIQGVSSVFSGSSVQVLAPQGASIFTYITGLQVANASANNVYLTLTGGVGSVLAYTVAPANGGSNIVLPNAWKTGANSGFSASVSGVSSIFLSAQGFISKT